LTKNQLSVQKSWYTKDYSDDKIRQIAFYSVNRQNSQTNDPLDAALADFGENTPKLKGTQVETYPFAQKLAMSGTCWSRNNSYIAYVKGSPAQVLANSKLGTTELKEINRKVLQFTQNA